MSKLPAITGREAIRAFQKAGFEIARTHSSHVILTKQGFLYNLSIPIHRGKALPKGLLRSQIKLAGLTVKEFCVLL